MNAAFRVGTVLEKRYKLQGVIGTGGETYVHLAKDLVTQERVAVRQYYKNTLEARLRWERERRISICSEHVVRHLGGGEESGSLYVVVEYVEGRSLEEMIEERGMSLPTDETVSIVCQIATGLSDLHEAGRVHRDLKPANVLFDGKKRVKIIDLGLVRCRGEETIADDGMARGTLHYMSAEHLTNPAAVDQRSDLYSLGVIFYQMATGTLPFDGAMAVDVQEKILHEEPIRPRVLSPGTSAEQEEVILRLLAKDPSRRFQSARLLLLHLNVRGPSESCPTCNAPMERGASYCPACGVDVRCAGSAPALLCVDAAAGPRWLAIPPEGRELGRETLDPGNPAVSSRHARIFRKQRSWYLEDLGSTNGSWVDGRRLQSSQALASRSFLQFANVTCVFWKKA